MNIEVCKKDALSAGRFNIAVECTVGKTKYKGTINCKEVQIPAAYLDGLVITARSKTQLILFIESNSFY